MPWYAKVYCPCCAGCAFREGNACAKRPRRVMCDAHCPDRAISTEPGALLTEEERAVSQRREPGAAPGALRAAVGASGLHAV